MTADDLFAPLAPESPLADRMRPRTLDGIRGQDHLVGPGAPLRRLLLRLSASLVKRFDIAGDEPRGGADARI